jgi:hypothetical protein
MLNGQLLMSALGQPDIETHSMSGLPPKADISRAHWDVRFVPILLQKSVASFFGR